MDNNYEKIWEAYLTEQSPPLPPARIAAPPAPSPGMPARPAAPAKPEAPAKPAAPEVPEVPAAPAAPAKPAIPVSMTTIQQAPEVLKALGSLFKNPAVLSVIKSEIAKAAKAEAGQPVAGSPGQVPGN